MQVRSRQICLWSSLMLAASLSSPAMAQDDSAEQQQPRVANQTLAPLQIRALVADDVADTPGAASILTDTDIETYRPLTLHDALNFTTGVRTIDDDALGLRSGIGVRGAPPRRSRKTLLLEDGTPITASNYLDPSAHYTPPIQRLERVEVLKGAGQVVHGPNNNHGIVNFRNKRATLTPETTVELGAGNQSQFHRHLMHRRTEGDVGLVFAYTGMNSDGVFDVETHQYDDFYASAAWDVNARHNLGASLTYFRERSRGYDENNLTKAEFDEDPRGKRRFGPGRRDNNIAVDYWKLDLSHDFQATDRLQLSSRVFYTDLDRPRFQSRNPGDASEDRVMEGRDRRYETFGGDTRASYTGIQTGAVDHTLEGGLRFERHDFEDRRPVGRPGEKLNQNRRGRLRAVAGEDGYTRDGRLVTFKAEAFSGYVQNQMEVGDFVITPGLRVESYRQEANTRFRPGSDTGAESEWNTLYLPGISFLYRGFEHVDAYAGLHRGFSPASARGEDFPLEPEKGTNAQIGVRSKGLRGVTFDTAVFYNRIKDTLIRDDVDAFGDALFINSADSDIYGLDVELRLDSAPFTDSDYNFFGFLAWNYTQAEFRSGPLDGNHVPEIPKQAGSFTLGMDHVSGIELSATLSYFGEFFSDVENTRRITEDGDNGRVPSRTLLSARASWHTDVGGTPTTFWVQGRNLTNKLYVSDVQDGLRPGAERTFLAGFTSRF